MDSALLRIPEAAERLACSRAYIYVLINQQELVPVHLGAAVRIPASQLEALIARKIQESRVRVPA
jgi:excisionase family DNA binding protein